MSGVAEYRSLGKTVLETNSESVYCRHKFFLNFFTRAPARLRNSLYLHAGSTLLAAKMLVTCS
uniref:Uncharacterized protein n=1 Tax=Anguilla anguilla TaxID=7936 RepID=A0A0E9RJR6_ANGAN